MTQGPSGNRTAHGVWRRARWSAAALATAVLTACGGAPDGGPGGPDLSSILSGDLLDEIEQAAGDPAAATPGPIRRPRACEHLSAEVASRLIGEAVEEQPAIQQFSTVGHTHMTQCDRHSAVFSTTNITLFVRHYSLARQTPDMTRRSALEVVRDKEGAEPIDGIGNWAVLDMDRRLVVAGDRLFFFVHFNDGTGLMDTRAILENAARTLWASLEEYDS
jgi:hypothetical protein